MSGGVGPLAPRVLALVALVACGSAVAAELVTMESRAVVAWPAQVLREAPAADARVLAQVPFGQEVTVVSSAEPGPCGSVAGVEGCWRPAHWEDHRGWMFDGWLMDLPVPPASCEGLEAWVARWVPQGSAVVELDGSSTGEVVQRRVQSYEGGMQAVRTEDGDSVAVRLWLPGISSAQAWFVARRCHPALAPLAEAGWPPHSQGGLSVQGAGDQLLVRAGTVTLLSLEQRADGVVLIWR